MSENINKTRDFSGIEKKLSVIISLLVRIANDNKDITLKDQIKDLASFGLNSSEIADILGKKVGYISKELSELKKSIK